MEELLAFQLNNIKVDFHNLRAYGYKDMTLGRICIMQTKEEEEPAISKLMMGQEGEMVLEFC